MARLVDIDVALDRYYAEWELQDICSGEEDRDWLMKCINEVPTIEAEHKWISVKDEPPKDKQNVLCWYEYFRYGDYNRMYQDYGIGSYVDGSWCGEVARGTDTKVLTWMPLPEPPKEEHK